MAQDKLMEHQRPHHKKTSSLVGFDPLLATDPAAETKQDFSTRVLSAVQSTEHSFDGQNGAASAPHSPKKVVEEIRPVSSHSSRESPQPTTEGKSHKIFPWQKKQPHHRKVQSLAAANEWSKVYADEPLDRPHSISNRSLSDQNAPVTKENENQWNTSSSLINDLWKSSNQSDIVNALSSPSLAKPRPTSFLTGREVILSSENEATEWQVGIPEKIDFEASAKLTHFLESYRSEECLLDLSKLIGCNRLDLSRYSTGDHSSLTDVLAECHQPIVESLLECGSDIVQVVGFVTNGNSDPHDRREVLILERQRQFICVFRGKTTEQHGRHGKQSDLVTLKENGNVSVFSDKLEAVRSVEKELFTILDKLTDENPFCDFIFTGHMFGAAMATLAAYRYAWARPELRVASLVFSCPKVGGDDLRMAANALSNLKIMNVQFVRSGQPNNNAGHSIRINTNKTPFQVRAYRYSDQHEHAAVRSLPLFKREKDIVQFVEALEDLKSWPIDFFKQDGEGVRGEDNDLRHVV